ncbi:flavin reductase family protein [Arthrobacter sp. JSM 101049]|uniref:flavin reductase family protein n=1 Tax=Arthrobacter sp. JSM 101049 TaxID=929097 RepID=UPI003569E7B5
MTTSSPAPLATEADPALFRDAFRGHPAGLAVITAAGPEGPIGLTASSVSSVSVDPPSLVFSLSGRTTAPLLAAAETVVVHLMDSGQADIVRTFATPGTARFTADQDWEWLPTGEPLLRRSPWSLRCRVDERLDVGSSRVVIAEVLEVRAGTPAGEPLVYHDRTYHRLSEASALS